MSESGIKILPDIDINSFKIDDEILKILKSYKELWKNFNSFPKLYQRVRIDSIQRERKKKDVYERMLQHFLIETKKGNIYGEWNDCGRLLDY